MAVSEMSSEYNHLLLGVIIMTCLGCSIAAAGEMRFDMFGFGCQSAAVVVSSLRISLRTQLIQNFPQVESSRLVLIQILLKDFKMDPLSSIAMYAPVSDSDSTLWALPHAATAM